MTTAEQSEKIVREFCQAFERGDAEALRPYFADDVVYHNIPMEPANGADAAVELLKGFFGMCDRIDIRITHLAANDNVVLTERVDAFIMGDKVAPLPVMGVFEIVDGRIAAWRDYFDLAQVTAMFTGGS